MPHQWPMQGCPTTEWYFSVRFTQEMVRYGRAPEKTHKNPKPLPIFIRRVFLGIFGFCRVFLGFSGQFGSLYHQFDFGLPPFPVTRLSSRKKYKKVQGSTIIVEKETLTPVA
jgi:hypothetical protein